MRYMKTRWGLPQAVAHHVLEMVENYDVIDWGEATWRSAMFVSHIVSAHGTRLIVVVVVNTS